MKCKLFINTDHEDVVEIYSKELTKEASDIKAFAENYEASIMGYIDEEAVKLSLSDVYCFTVEDNKVFACTTDKKYRLRQRLYQVEEMLTEDFIKVNQSCVVSASKVAKFEAPLSGALNIVLKNGHKDYVSRRNMKSVKERFLK